jgi:hypothetical protein
MAFSSAVVAQSLLISILYRTSFVTNMHVLVVNPFSLVRVREVKRTLDLVRHSCFWPDSSVSRDSS